MLSKITLGDGTLSFSVFSNSFSMELSVDQYTFFSSITISWFFSLCVSFLHFHIPRPLLWHFFCPTLSLTVHHFIAYHLSPFLCYHMYCLIHFIKMYPSFSPFLGLVATVKEHITKPTAMAQGRVAHLIEWKGWGGGSQARGSGVGWSGAWGGMEAELQEDEQFYSQMTDEIKEARFAAGETDEWNEFKKNKMCKMWSVGMKWSSDPSGHCFCSIGFYRGSVYKNQWPLRRPMTVT